MTGTLPTAGLASVLDHFSECALAYGQRYAVWVVDRYTIEIMRAQLLAYERISYTLQNFPEGEGFQRARVRVVNRETLPQSAPDATGWNAQAKLCGNCEFWALSDYRDDPAGAEPHGRGGDKCDGSMSDCRAKSPGEYDWPGYGTRKWPQVKREDWCGQWQMRRGVAR